MIATISNAQTSSVNVDDPLGIGITLEKMNRYKDQINLNENRSIYPTYIAPIKISTTNEVEYVKRIFERYSIIATIGTQRTLMCNRIGVEYSLLDFLKLNKDLNRVKYEREIKNKEDEIKSLISLEWSDAGKTCKETYGK